MIRADGTGKLAQNCRHKMKYRKRKGKKRETRATNIRNRTSIHQGLAEADGKRFGDWEMDLIVDGRQNAILTVTERSTNFLMMERIRQGKKAFFCIISIINAAKVSIYRRLQRFHHPF